jgi:hypothetical protein
MHIQGQKKIAWSEPNNKIQKKHLIFHQEIFSGVEAI